jgi:hypothetical protein
MDGTLGIVMGKLTDRFGPKRVLIVCGLWRTGYILVSRVTEIWQMYLLYGIMVGTGMGGFFIRSLPTWPLVYNQPQYHERHYADRYGVGPWLFHQLLMAASNYGWKTSYVVIGVGFMIWSGRRHVHETKTLQNSETKLGTIKTQLNLQNRNYSLSEAFIHSSSAGFRHVLLLWLFRHILQVHLVPHI